MLEKYKNDWLDSINSPIGNSGRGGNKLRTYCTFKNHFGAGKYCTLILPKRHRSALCKFRCGIVLLKLETGRYEGLPVDIRICLFCSQTGINAIEKECHVLLECNLYNDLRNKIFEKVSDINPSFSNLCNADKFQFLLNSESLIRILATICFFILNRRRLYVCK